MGLHQKQIEAIAAAVQRRMEAEWERHNLEGEVPVMPLGWVELVAEETINMSPLLLLQPERFTGNKIATLDDPLK